MPVAGEPAILFYRLIIGPLLLVLLIWNWTKGKETRASLRDRFALARNATPQAPHIWVHGASVGELVSARHLIATLLDSSKLNLIITTNSATGQAMVESWQLPRTSAVRAPADAFGAVGRFLSNWSVAALVSLESEIWPLRVEHCTRRNIPVFGVATRLPAAARRGRWFARLNARALRQYAKIWPQNVLNETLLQPIIDQDRMGPIYSAKATLDETAASSDFPVDLNAWQDRQVILAASTHAPEEQLLASALARAIKSNPDVRLIMAPRHAERGPQIARLLEKEGIPMACRSEHEPVTDNCRLYIADTLHEMDHWYRAADWTIIGGTFAPKGGHTPVEPVLKGSVPVHGPDCRNHQDIFDKLTMAGGTLALMTEDDLRQFLASPPDQNAHASLLHAAQQTIQAENAKAKAMGKDIAATIIHALNDGNR